MALKKYTSLSASWTNSESVLYKRSNLFIFIKQCIDDLDKHTTLLFWPAHIPQTEPNPQTHPNPGEVCIPGQLSNTVKGIWNFILFRPPPSSPLPTLLPHFASKTPSAVLTLSSRMQTQLPVHMCMSTHTFNATTGWYDKHTSEIWPWFDLKPWRHIFTISFLQLAQASNTC